MVYKKKICKGCGKEQYIVSSKYCLCQQCNNTRLHPEGKKAYTIKKQSSKQKEINKHLKEVYIEMDRITKRICVGCGKKHGEVRLSRSHIISQSDCKKIRRPELIYDSNNIQYLCLSVGKRGCHEIWEDTDRNTLLCYTDNMKYIRSISEEMYNKYNIE